MPRPTKKPFQDFYLLFGLQQTATQSEIKTAYRELALKLHPDKNPSPEAHKQFLLLNEAYRILNNPDERNKYDIRYKNYYDPHKKSAGISERIEINRAKRASRYGRSMYSQRMRYRGSNPGYSRPRSHRSKTSYTQRESTYNWDQPDSDEADPAQKKYTSLILMLVAALFLFATYNVSDYFFRTLSVKLAFVAQVPQASGDVKVFARRSYYNSHTFYVAPKDTVHFAMNTFVQLERSYFKGRLYQIRVHKKDEIILLEPTRAFYDYSFYLLILIMISGVVCVIVAKNPQRTMIWGSITFLLTIIWSIST